MIPLATLLCGGLFVVAIPCIVIARIALAPAFAAAQKGRLPVQYQVSDLAMLTVYVALALGISYSPLVDIVPLAPTSRIERIMQATLLGSLCLVAAGMWWIGVRTLSRGGVEQLSQRFLYLAIVPAIYLSAASVIPLALMGFSDIFDDLYRLPPRRGLFLATLSTTTLIAGRFIAQRIFSRRCA